MTDRATASGFDAAPRRLELFIDVSPAVPGRGERLMATDVFLPRGDHRRTPPTVLCCLPGGGVDRRYFDLQVPEDDTHSFAAALTAQGFVVVTADHLNVGDSSNVAPLELTVEALAAAAHHAMSEILDRLRRGAIADMPAAGDLLALGVGHSMGAMLTAIQQARRRTYQGVALLGFGHRGLPQFLPPELVERAADPDRLRADLPELMRARSSSGMAAPRSTARASSRQSRDSIFHGQGVPRHVVDAVKAIAAPPPPLAATTSLVPGSVNTELAMLDVPVFLANGEHDLTGPPHEIVARFTASSDVTLVVLPGSGHSHHAFPARTLLWDRLAIWAATVPAAAR